MRWRTLNSLLSLAVSHEAARHFSCGQLKNPKGRAEHGLWNEHYLREAFSSFA